MDLDRLKYEFNTLVERKPFDMTPLLAHVEDILPSLLQDRAGWKSLMIDYQPPYLMRLYRQIGDVRINLHYFLPSDKLAEQNIQSNAYDENLYHPHAWASVMRILQGSYEQFIGFAHRAGLDAAPEKTLHTIHMAGDVYAMNHPWLWHQVVPHKNEAVSTLMITYIPKDWDQSVPKSSKELRCLEKDELDFMFKHFSRIYSGPSQKKTPEIKTNI